jgi:ubiquinone/menaquinone biosynthesis C-methylase UbiE
MGIWEKYLFPRLLDRAMRQLGDLRDEALSPCHGNVLEIGFGTGLNLRHYPEAVRSLAAIDPMDALQEKVAQRIERAPFPVERLNVAADGSLPFGAEQFDCVVTTWTLCSIAESVPVLEEVRRVLRPGGRFVFIEHGLSDDERTARRQQRLSPLWSKVAGGCRLDRPIDQLVTKAGLELTALDRFRQPDAPRIFAEMYRGIATPG